jgi:hypothetical protein
MALVIEDGTGVANATSLATLAQIRAFAEARGKTVPADDDALERLAILAMDVIRSIEPQLPGDREHETQRLPYPRSDWQLFGVDVAAETIPPEVIELHAAIVIELAAGINFFPSAQDRALKRTKTGPLEKEWFDSDMTPTTPFIDALLAPLLGRSGKFALTVRRV